ncbi:hypothetical protein G9A89_000069 [Geosiphon pyriformis]|nr:hypothetical protein G9A89_000069 [Geosiphon pyriformis]
MQKAYNSVGWEHLKNSLVKIKMCSKFIRFFGSIHKNCTNCVMTDFGLTNGYHVHDGLDQGEHQESVCKYRLNSHFVSKSGHAKSQAGLFSFFAASAFVDDTIWVGSSQNATQHILNVAGKFFQINNISINNDKTVVIPINCRYLGIFISTEGLLKPSLAKANLDVCFFTNLYYGIAFVDQLWDRHGDVFSWLIFKWWKRLDPHGPVSEWFKCSVEFLVAFRSFLLVSVGVGPVDICGSGDFASVCDCLSRVGTDSLSVYTDGSLKNLGTTGCRAGTAAFFEDINLGLGISVRGLVSSTLAELQAIALALECILVARSVCLFSDSQAALDAYMSEINLVYSDFHNQCWVEHQHIRNVIHSKNLRVSWHKVKSHSGMLGNNWADSITNTTTLSDWFLPPCVDEHFLLVDDSIVSGNSRHFVRNVFHAVCRVCWKVSSSSGFLSGDLHLDVDWPSSFRVWHSDSHMATDFTSRRTVDIHTYLMKALHHWLPMAVRKCIYNRCYPSVLCLYCGEVEVLESCMSSWKTLSGLALSSSSVLQLLLTCASDFLVFSALYKGFVFKGWIQKAVSIFHNPKVAGIKIADFVCSFCVAFRNNIWLVHAKHHTYMKRNGLISMDDSISVSVSGLVSRFLGGVVKLLGIVEVFGIRFGFHKSCSFFLSINDPVSVNIIV